MNSICPGEPHRRRDQVEMVVADRQVAPPSLEAASKHRASVGGQGEPVLEGWRLNLDERRGWDGPKPTGRGFPSRG